MPSPAIAMGKIRPFRQGDIPEVAALQWKHLHDRNGPPPRALGAYLDSLFLSSPFCDEDLPSLVYEDTQGRLTGFLGIVPHKMFLYGRPVRVAFGSGLVVHPQSRRALAGLQLLTEFMKGKQELAMTDTASHLSREIWSAIGGSAADIYGLQWSRPLRPSLYAFYGLARVSRSALIGPLRRACRPLCRVADAVVTRISGSPWNQAPLNLREEELDVKTLLHCYSTAAASYALRPDYQVESLDWLVNFTSQMKAYGDLRRVALRDRGGKLAGWYIYYLKSGGIGEVAQVGTMGSQISAILDHLFHDALAHGAIAVHGRLDIRFAQEFSEKGCFFWGSVPLLVHSRKAELIRLLQNGEAFLTRLDGEWCLRFGEHATLSNLGLTTRALPIAKEVFANSAMRCL